MCFFCCQKAVDGRIVEKKLSEFVKHDTDSLICSFELIFLDCIQVIRYVFFYAQCYLSRIRLIEAVSGDIFEQFDLSFAYAFYYLGSHFGHLLPGFALETILH